MVLMLPRTAIRVGSISGRDDDDPCLLSPRDDMIVECCVQTYRLLRREAVLCKHFLERSQAEVGK